MIDPTGQSIIIHFKDGSIQTGILQSRSLIGKTIRYIPQSLIDDRRRGPRVNLIKEVTINELCVQRGVDLSTHGMYVESLTPYPVGSALPVSLRFGHETIELEARVIFNDPGIGMGLEFHRLTSSVRHKLEALVQYALKSSENRLSRDRRIKGDRRMQKSNGHDKQRRWDFRKRERRQRLSPMKTSPTEVEFSRLKSIFFADQDGELWSQDGVSYSVDKEVVVAFHDGEEIQGTLPEISSESMGFFMNLYLSQKIFYSVYVIKTAVKSIRYL